MEKHLKFIRMLTPEENRPVSTVKAWAVRVEVSEASKMVTSLRKYPIPPHLKRVKKVDGYCLCLIAFKSGVCADYIELEDSVFALNCMPPELVDVPEYPPCTPIQYAHSRIYWPCNYTNIQQEEIEETDAIKIMSVLLKNHKESIENSVDESIESEIENSTKQCIKECAKQCIIADGNRILTHCTDSDNVLGHAILKAVENVSKSKQGYLCTGLSAYIYKEPCLSCAMALVHGRIKNVFCFTKDTSGRGSYSTSQLNYNRNTNHRYPVYFCS